jgi:hypothetical protein
MLERTQWEILSVLKVYEPSNTISKYLEGKLDRVSRRN